MHRVREGDSAFDRLIGKPPSLQLRCFFLIYPIFKQRASAKLLRRTIAPPRFPWQK
ncbi:hypothetical protein [Paraburkholderia silvatlantica]|uniref:hypothetical protein n=1 Tax=Paraburkholderia silvatlantica TaxID=321895 RepID=UPI003751E3D4